MNHELAPLLPHQQRVVTERAELFDKTTKLLAFIGGAMFDGLDPAEQERLRRQADLMNRYVAVLDERIAAF